MRNAFRYSRNYLIQFYLCMDTTMKRIFTVNDLLITPRSNRIFLILLACFALLSCSNITPQDYAQESPALDFKRFLQGDLTGWGIYQERGGHVAKRFRIDMTADWQGNVGKFTERFSFNDGTKQVREWVLTRIDDHHYIGKANDSIGSGKGEVWGNSMHWNYTIRTKTDSGTYDLDYDYWMYLIDDKTLINRATLSKFGFALGDISVTFQKH